ncbi:MAG: prepilin-type N-terminal cleavage/methylation domain-containing protein, partial [Geminicoccaceae bacterium]
MNEGRKRDERSAGFTLMELLVAMTLLGILMTALFGSLRLGTRVWETSDRVLKHEGEAMAIRTFLHDRFEQAMPVVLLGADGRSDIVFAGERSVLRFASTMPESVGFGPYVIALVLTPGLEEPAAADLSIRWRLVANSEVTSAAD